VRLHHGASVTLIEQVTPSTGWPKASTGWATEQDASVSCAWSVQVLLVGQDPSNAGGTVGGPTSVCEKLPFGAPGGLKIEPHP
jgi:hypothetical protein